jgi:hypothetical protein
VAGIADIAQTYDFFLATLPTPDVPPWQCGDPVADASIAGDASSRPALVKATDGLFMLRAAIALETCAACVCDVDGSGAVTATDALIALKIAVGQQIELACPAC